MASEKITAMIEEVKALTVLELAELVHALEEEFGVSSESASLNSDSNFDFDLDSDFNDFEL